MKAPKSAQLAELGLTSDLLVNLPALWILAGFAAGIAIAERCPGSLRLWAVAAALGILAGGILAAGFLAWRHTVLVAWICALLAWVAIGGVAVSVERAAFAGAIARRSIDAALGPAIRD